MTSSRPTPGFRGVFIGIDRYDSPEIGNLASAARDATALHALFSDNLGGACTLITDSDATTRRLRDELDALAHICTDDDFVVISFSGHGSDSHEIVTFDTDRYNISGTALALSEFTDLISAIPAKHLLIVLDCCFSGGAGAKVLHATHLPRGTKGGLPLSTEAFMKQMTGKGRVILTASTADQEAWEDPRLGHGYLTYYLLQSLLGATGDPASGSVNLLDLLKYVIESVRSGASGTYGARQDPTLRGQWDGEVTWPVFAPGPIYSALFPSAHAAPATRNIQSLAPYGLPASILDTWSAAMPGLNQLQQDAINQAGLLDGRNVLVMAPTSSGKTMIGELAALRATQVGGRSVFLLPTKALVNEQYERFNRTYGPSGIRVLRATGDHNDEVGALLRGQFDIAILTYEKFTGLALAQPHLLRIVSVVVVDEVQTIVDRSRGQGLELLLTLIKSRKDEGVEPQIIALSAVLGELNGLDSWLDAVLLKTAERPVPLDEGVLDRSGNYHFIDADGNESTTQLINSPWGDPRAQTLLVPLVQKLVGDGQQVIVIRGERGAARGAAAYLAQSLGLAPATKALEELPTGDPTQSTDLLRQTLAGGVAFHISDLGRDERRVIEEHFRAPDSQIRVVVATTTLAQGINMPAETVIMPELNRRIGGGTVGWYTVAEYKNIAGRAGRLGLTDRGRAIVLAWDSATANTIWSRYITGVPEDIHSTLLGDGVDLYSVVLRIVTIAAERSSDHSVAVDSVVAILADSLAAHQARLSGGADAFSRAQIQDAIAELQQVGLLEVLDQDRTKLSSLGQVVATGTLSVTSAVRVAATLRQTQPAELNAVTILATAQITEELDATRLNVNKKGVQKELNTYLNDLSSRGAAHSVMNQLTNAAPVAAAARAKKAIACLLWTSGVALGQIEQYVMRHYFDRNASGPIGGVTSRTHDVIGTVLAMIAEIHPTVDIENLVNLLPIQLELGVTPASARLALAGADLRREDYMRLTQAGLFELDDIAGAGDDLLLPLVHDDLASVRSLRAAVTKLRSAAPLPSLDQLLGPVEDAE
ncbi:Replicative superfamily II helicase [Frankineae bacterium MT45]|nr:Replicative superfamily II helicase [Frankineae bacterium MT45]